MDGPELFEALTLDEIKEFVSSEQEENLHLDFKTITDARLKNHDDKRNLAKALSGYANSNGGLIIWGVDARKNNEDIDCAVAIQGIENYKLFLTRLNEFTGIAVSPIVDGIKHRAIKIADEKGIVITFCPESESGPHMAKMGEDRYYKRSGDSFYRLEHFDLEDMFGRRPKPKLAFHTRIQGLGLGAEIIVGIRNEGKGSAKAPYLAFGVTPPFKRDKYGLDGNMGEGMKKLPHSGSDLHFRYGEGTNVVIHPGITFEVTKIQNGLNHKNMDNPENDLTIEYEMAAEDYMLNRGKKIISLRELGFS